VRSPRLLLALSLLVTLMVPVLLALISVRLVMTETYLVLEYNKPDFPPDEYGFTLADRLRLAPYALQYIMGNAGIEYLGNLTVDNGQPLSTQGELQHMIDVKTVVHAGMLVLAATAVLFVVVVGIMARSSEGRRWLRRGLFSGALLVLVILAGLVTLLVVNWDTFFTGFHDLFFASGTWVFDYSDTLIRLFPVRFWQDAALTIGGTSAVGALIILIGCWWWARHERTLLADSPQPATPL